MRAADQAARRRVEVEGVVIAREWVEMLGQEGRQLGQRRRLELQLRVAQHLGNVLTDRDQQALEQQEGFLLVFVDRLLLRVAAQVNDLPQRIERRQMLLP